MKSYKIVLLTPEQNSKTKILGKSVEELTLNVFENYSIAKVKMQEGASLQQLLQEYLQDYQYIAVFYSDTPLISQKSIEDSLDYAMLKELDVCKLPRGYVFATSYLQNPPTNPNVQEFSHYGYEYIQANTAENVIAISKNIKQTKANEHIRNGVTFVDLENTYFEYNVQIGKNTIIYPHNQLLGSTTIAENCIVFGHNTIIDSSIGKNCTIGSCFLQNKRVKNSTKLINKAEL